jgi:hypothetical protein
VNVYEFLPGFVVEFVSVQFKKRNDSNKKQFPIVLHDVEFSIASRRQNTAWAYLEKCNEKNVKN